uniref:Uncharacterized protein n=1 Tax=Electrophorus electricus TaxID=8005 RepID=A0A4W4HMR8_ELEEL
MSFLISWVAYEWTYEYYYDYMDPVTVDASKLRYNRYSIVIIFWITMAAFIGLFIHSVISILGVMHVTEKKKSQSQPLTVIA